jgi:hypothetical protein
VARIVSYAQSQPWRSRLIGMHVDGSFRREKRATLVFGSQRRFDAMAPYASLSPKFLGLGFRRYQG